MSYAASLLATYPSSYGSSNLLSDDLVQRTSYDNLYTPSVPYMSSGRLLSDDLAFNQLTYDSTNYRPSLYPLPDSTPAYPTTKYPKSFVTNQHKTVPPNDSFASLNDITEYSDSLVTASNTNTASSVARSFNGPTTMDPNYNRLSSYDNDTPQGQSIWSPPKPKQKGSTNEIKTKPTVRSKPSTVVYKKAPPVELDDDVTPVQSPRPLVPSTKQKTTSVTEINRQSPVIDIQAWVNETEKDSPIDEKSAEQAWSVKIGQLHQVQAQREKDKAKSSRALPTAPKQVESKLVTSKAKSLSDSKSRDITHQATSDSYFDSLFEGDYFRRVPTNDFSTNLSLQQATTKRTKPATTSFNTNSNANNVLKTPKSILQRKTPRYEPPTPKRVPPSITTTSWRKQWPKEYHFDPLYPHYLHNELTYRDMVHKDSDERFREALQKVRADRAEQQQKEINEKTAKRLHYGDYVRHSTKDALLQNAVKPSPWSDFMDLKKGNLYTLSKEEKKQLYNQSRNYGERVRHRNFAIQYANETSRSQRHSVPLLDELQEAESGNATPRQPAAKSVSRTSKRPDSASTNKSHTKQTGARSNRTMATQSSRASIPLNRSNNSRPSDDEYENLSNPDPSRSLRQKSKQKNVRIAKYDSSGRTINGTDESENEHDNHSQRMKTRADNNNNNDDLYTVREEKTLESFEGARYKKR